MDAKQFVHLSQGQMQNLKTQAKLLNVEVAI